MQNHTSGPHIAPMFSIPSNVVAVNLLSFASVTVILIATFLCMLVNVWTRAIFGYAYT